MTECDVRNYLEKIYKLPVASIRSAIHAGEMPVGKGSAYLVKKYDYRLCHVHLPIGQSFKHPGEDLFAPDGQSADVTDLKQGLDHVETMRKAFRKKTWKGGRDMPTWWFTSAS